MKNILLLMTLTAVLILCCNCNKANTDDAPVVRTTETITTKSQSAAVSDILNAAKMLGDGNVNGVIMDMTQLGTLELGDASLTESISVLMSAVDKNPAKSLKLIIPNLSVRGKVNMPHKFYELTRGSNTYNASTRANGDTSEAPATIIIKDDGSLHFNGELKSSELLTVMSEIGTDARPNITADCIRITERMGTALDGPAYGLPLWAIFHLVKTDEIAAGADAVTGRGFDGSGSVLFGHLGDEGRTEVTNAENLMFYDFGDDELLRSSTPAHRRENARVVFDKPINMTAEFFTDTVRMGGSWNNGVWTPDKDSWLDVIAESQLTYGRPYIVYPKGFLQMTPEQRKEKHRLIIHTEGVEEGSYIVIDGVKRHWVNLEEIIAFNKTVLTGNGQIKWRPGVPLAVRVPTERTPAELKDPTSTGELHSWDNFFFYDCRIDIDWLPNKTVPIVSVVDPTMEFDLTRAKKIRAMTRAAAVVGRQTNFSSAETVRAISASEGE